MGKRTIKKHKVEWIILLLFFLRIFLLVLTIFAVTKEFSWGIFHRWDAIFYLRIAKYGYDPSSIVFLPFYLFLIMIGALPLRNYIISGVIISNIFYFLSLFLLYQVTIKLTKDKLTSFLSVLFFSVFPSGFYTSLIYSESVFIFFTLLLFHYSLQKIGYFRELRDFSQV